MKINLNPRQTQLLRDSIHDLLSLKNKHNIYELNINSWDHEKYIHSISFNINLLVELSKLKT
jgi:hypothetical protein